MAEGKHIPVEVLTNILSRVPGSSLARFRFVSKLWDSLICDPYFIDLHSHRTSTPCFAILSCGDEAIKSHLTVLDEAGTTKHSLRWESKAKSFMTQPCNGFFCLYHYNGNIQLCNPTTRQLLDLPNPPNHKNPFDSSFHFGFHPATKEYKVLYVHRYKECEVYTLGTGLWRQIRRLDYEISRRGVASDGAIYLLTWHLILLFDLEDEGFTEIPFPTSVIDGKKSLLEIEGNICLVVNLDHKLMDIWKLKDYKNQVWIYKYRVRADPRPFSCLSEVTPICIRKGKIWLKSATGLYSYDLKKDGLRLEEAYRSKCLHGALAYVENLDFLENP